jgi:hypothetical protein
MNFTKLPHEKMLSIVVKILSSKLAKCEKGGGIEAL